MSQQSQNQNYNSSSNPNYTQNHNPNYNQSYSSENQRSPNQLVIPEASRRAMEALNGARALKSDFLSLERSMTYRLKFDKLKSNQRISMVR